MPVLAPEPVQALADNGSRHADLRGLAREGFGERDLHVVAEVLAALASRTLARAARAHELAEQIVEHRRHRGGEIGAEAEAAAVPGKAAVERGVAEAVVGRAALRIFQRLIGLVEFLEASLGGGIAVALVWMAFLGEAAKSGLDVGVTDAALHTKYVVVTPLCHRPPALYTAVPLARCQAFSWDLAASLTTCKARATSRTRN